MDIDKYINPLNLEIKARNNKFINIKCPICGDSKTNKYKARGFIMLDDIEPYYNCFNESSCSGSFYKFLKALNPNIANSYYSDTKLRNRDKEEKQYKEEIKNIFDIKEIDSELLLKEEIYNPLELNYKKFDKAYYTFTTNNEQITTTEELSELSDEAKEYLYNRGFTNDDIIDIKFVENRNDIVIPLWLSKKDNIVYGMQMRSIVEKRFHNQLFENKMKITNLEHLLSLPKGSKVYLFEAEFDRISTILKDSCALLGSSFSDNIFKTFKGLEFIFCGDADDEGIKKSIKYAKEGLNVLVHTDDMFEYKDFNKLLEEGLSKEEITEYILENIKSPNRALMELRKWL